MKLLTTLIFTLSLTFGAMAVDKAQLDIKAQKIISKFQKLQEKPDKRIPAEALNKARGIILLDRTKAGFVFAYQGGGGVAMVKDQKGKWGPVAFMQANEASLGFQVGGQQTFFVILLMNEESAKTLIADAAFEFGGEARGTAGNASTGAEGKVDDIERAVLVYDDRHGLYGGAAVKGGAISPDQDANLAYYGRVVTMKEILFDGKVKITEPARELAKRIYESTKTGK